MFIQMRQVWEPVVIASVGLACLLLYAPTAVNADPYHPYVIAEAGVPSGGLDENEGLFQAAADSVGVPFLGSPEAHAAGDLSPITSGESSVFCQMNLHDPLGNDLDGNTYVETLLPFLVTSSTLAPGTPVTINVALNYEGSLQADEPTTGLASTAYAEFLMGVYDINETLLDGREGEAEVENAGGSVTTDEFGSWIGSLTPGTLPGEYLLAYSDTISFTGQVGMPYGIYTELSGRASTSAGGSGQNTLALVDFFNTGSYTLSSPDDVGFAVINQIPEPSTLVLMLLGIGALVLLGRRRGG